MNEFSTLQAVPPELKQPLADMLLCLGDDELILGYWDSEWTGVAPMLEEDVACSSIAQDEIGHARLFYQHVEALTGTPIDQLAYGRQPEQYRQAALLDNARGDWAFTIARQYLYDTADQIRLSSMCTSAYIPLAQDIAKIEREETYHQMHVHIWLERLAHGTLESRQRLEKALQQLWGDALGLFEELPGEDTLLRAGILTTPSQQLRQQWLATIAPTFERLQLLFPASGPDDTTTIKPRSGRSGQHNEDFYALWQEMTMVYRLEPQAQW